MLDALRKGAGGWLAQLMIAALVIAFAVWGVSDVFTGFRGDTVATIGRTSITIPEFQRQYETTKRQFSQQIGQPITDEQARMFGIPQQVLSQLVSSATLDDAARSLGLGISNKTLADQIRDDPAFKGPNGTFDRLQFGQILQQAGYTEAQYVAYLRGSYLRRQIADGLGGGETVPDAYMEALHEYQTDKRNISYVIVTAAMAGEVPAPTDADLQKYFEAHKADWKAPEYRAVSYVAMTPADLAKPDEVSDDEAKKAYDAQAARFTTPETRKVEQIVFKDKADADAAAAALAGGKTFDDLLAERNLKPADVDLGVITKDKLIDPAVAEATFGLAAPGVSPVIAGRFGPVMVRVSQITPAVTKSFDEVKADLKKEIATQRATQEVTDQHDVIEDARAGGETLAEVAQKYGLKLVTLAALDKEGKDKDGKDVPGLPAGLTSAAFDTDVGLENAPLAVGGGGYVWYDVTAVTQARDRELSEVKDKIAEAWKREQVEEKLTAKANDLRDRLQKGEDIAKAAGDLGAEVKTVSDITRSTKASGDLTQAAILGTFSGPKGTAAVAAGAADQTKVVLVVTASEVPPYFSDAPDMAQAKSQLADQLSNDFLTGYMTQLQAELGGVSVNQAALAQAIGATQPGS
ncbi:MAG: SurA N-terminal domain-containing protein [Rhizobiales bacterium]|nr:SurA N-terminal domain-containing protein [Hyphomicrobiales bacterium]